MTFAAIIGSVMPEPGSPAAFSMAGRQIDGELARPLPMQLNQATLLQPSLYSDGMTAVGWSPSHPMRFSRVTSYRSSYW